eukprot:g6293.t1
MILQSTCVINEKRIIGILAGTYANTGCVNGRAQIVAQAGDFMVDLVSPWLKSEPFIFYAMNEMKRLNISGLKGRAILTQLFKDGKTLDTERYSLMLNTSERISKAVSSLHGNDRKREMENLKQHQNGKRKMNHLLSFPLVGSFQFSAQFSDLDMDGFMDLIISGDFGTSAVYWNNGGGKGNTTFTQGHFHLLEDLLDNSMGATVGDYDMDGKLDVMFTSVSISSSDLSTLNQVAATAGMLLSFRGNHIYKNVGGRIFEDVTSPAGIRDSGWGWGAFFFDFDNDGDMDALNGNGMDDPETTDDDWAVNQKMKLYVNQGDEENYKMIDEASLRGINNLKENRGAMVFDFDLDGDLDVFVVNHADKPSLYKNNGGNYYDYIRVEVKEPSGRDAIGAKVYMLLDNDTTRSNNGDATNNQEERDEDILVEQLREIGNSAAFLGQSEAVAHFGLGLRRTPVYRIRIVWPTIIHQPTVHRTIYNIPTRSHLVFYRNSSFATSTNYTYKEGVVDLEKCAHRAIITGRNRDSNTMNDITNDVVKDDSSDTLSGSGGVNSFTRRLQHKFKQAALFFEKRMKSVDRIIEIARSKGLSDRDFIKLIEKKYPMVRRG